MRICSALPQDEEGRPSNGGWTEGMTYVAAGAIVAAVVLLAALMIYRRGDDRDTGAGYSTGEV